MKNLEALIDSQLSFKSLADMSDLESAINDAETSRNLMIYKYVVHASTYKSSTK